MQGSKLHLPEFQVTEEEQLTKHLSQASPVTSRLQRHSPVRLLQPSLLNVPNKWHVQGRQPFGSSAESIQNPFLQRSHLKQIWWVFCNLHYNCAEKYLPWSVNIRFAVALASYKSSLCIFLTFTDPIIQRTNLQQAMPYPCPQKSLEALT